MNAEERALKLGNRRTILRNCLYLTSSKALLLLLISLLTFAVGVQGFAICKIYTDDRDGVRNVFRQGRRFDYATSVPFQTEVGVAVGNILRHALVYQDIENFSGGGLLAMQIAQEEERRDTQIETVTAVCEWQIEQGAPEEKYIQKGFVRVAAGGYAVDAAAIATYYQQTYEELIEGMKRNADSEYRNTEKYLAQMHGTYYAVVDHSTQRIVTNTNCTSRADLQRFFSDTDNNLIVYDSDEPVYPTQTMQQFVPVVEAAAEAYTQAFDFYLAFEDGLVFNDACAQIESRCTSLYRSVAGRLKTAGFCAAAVLALSVILLCVAGRREYRGEIKYCATDRLPNEVHLLFHLMILLSMLVLLQSSVDLVLRSNNGSVWFPTFPEYYAHRGEICLVVLVLTVLGMLCTCKRQYKNKSLLSNTILALLLRRFKRGADVSQEDVL